MSDSIFQRLIALGYDAEFLNSLPAKPVNIRGEHGNVIVIPQEGGDPIVAITANIRYGHAEDEYGWFTMRSHFGDVGNTSTGTKFSFSDATSTLAWNSDAVAAPQAHLSWASDNQAHLARILADDVLMAELRDAAATGETKLTKQVLCDASNAFGVVARRPADFTKDTLIVFVEEGLRKIDAHLNGGYAKFDADSVVFSANGKPGLFADVLALLAESFSGIALSKSAIISNHAPTFYRAADVSEETLAAVRMRELNKA